MKKTTTFLIDPDRLCREGLAKLLEDSPFEVVFQDASIGGALAEVEAGRVPEVVLVGYGAGTREEVELVAKLREAAIEARIIVLSTQKNTRLLASSLKAGVDAFLLKDMSAEALERALSLVMTGEKVMPTQLATMLISGKLDTIDAPVAQRNINRLSGREVQILRCLVNGYPNKVIASRLSITEATVKVHLKGVLKKINATNRTQAAIWAIRNGLAEDTLETAAS